MNEYRTAVQQKTAELIGKGVLPQAAARRARKACKHLHPAHKVATARNLAMVDTRFQATGDTNSFNHI